MPISPQTRLVQALHYAAEQHRHQRRKDVDASPYINHPIALLHILSVEAGVDDQDVLIAAVLHDVIEDCSGPGQIHIEARRTEIREQFGERVLELVEAVSDDKSLPKPERKRAQLAHAGDLPYGARLIKLADKTANLRDLADFPPDGWSRDRLEQYVAWAGDIVDAIRGTHPRLEALFDAASVRFPQAA